jgi:NADH-ubiquinone oxidoreductase chain 5
MVSDDIVCTVNYIYLAGFYSKDFILEMFSMRYLNMFGFFLLFVSTGLTVCYSFRLFNFVICGDFNFVSSCSIVETNYNMVFGIIGLLVILVVAL